MGWDNSASVPHTGAQMFSWFQQRGHLFQSSLDPNGSPCSPPFAWVTTLRSPFPSNKLYVEGYTRVGIARMEDGSTWHAFCGGWAGVCETGNTFVQSPPRTVSPEYARPTAERNNQWQCPAPPVSRVLSTVPWWKTDAGTAAWAKLVASNISATPSMCPQCLAPEVRVSNSADLKRLLPTEPSDTPTQPSACQLELCV